jgi:hypothetical protein
MVAGRIWGPCRVERACSCFQTGIDRARAVVDCNWRHDSDLVCYCIRGSFYGLANKCCMYYCVVGLRNV